MGETTVESSVYKGFITPHHLRTDEISSIAIYEYREMKRLDLKQPPPLEIKFWNNPECPSDKLEEFLNEDFLPIEIGDFSYRTVDASSATEALVRTLGYDLNSLTYGEIKLIEILARRNKDGYMNQFYISLPRILKNLYDLPGYDELDLISRFKDVVHAFLDYENRPEDSIVYNRDELFDLQVATIKCQLAPFTPGRYLRDLSYRNEPVDKIREKVLFWITAWNRFQSEFAKAQHEWPRANKLRFSLNGLDAAAIETENKFFPKVCFGKEQAGRVDLLVIKSSGTGHTAVLSRRKDSLALYSELARLEPDRWYRHEPTGNLLNGGPKFPEVTPTSLTLSELAGLVAKFPPR